ncbi:MAG: hypothetical protein M3373_01145 [Gemmatimonadota bacterium]|nr:hypothetical protein [Gemmatimonadota bacterium]
MRALADRERIRRLMEAFGRAASGDVRVYLVGGTTAVLIGWRESTIDVDFVMRPEDDAILRSVPALKELLQVNVEIASPADFIPVPPGWEDRGTFIAQVQRVAFYHFDLYAQALAKVERAHRQDLADVREMIGRGLIDRGRAIEYFARVEPDLYRFPAIHAPSFRRAVEEAFG